MLARQIQVSPFWFTLVISFVLLFSGSSAMAGKTSGPATEPLTIVTSSGSHRFDVEIARTDEEQRLGLMFRNSLPERSGMLFLYSPPQEITMWMRNTRISLDMVFIKADGTVLRVAAETEPYSLRTIASKGDAAAVLEINGGLAAKLGILPGDRITHPAFPAQNVKKLN